MKKTLLITLEYPPQIGGVAHYYKNLVSRLPDESIRVLDNRDGKLTARARWLWPKWIPGLIHSIRTVREQRIEHVLVGQILPIGTIALIMKLFLGIPYTVMTHAMDVTRPFAGEVGQRRKWLVKKIIKYAHSITTVSIYTRLHLEELGARPRDITMIYPCANVSPTQGILPGSIHELDTQYNLAGKKVVLSVCRLVKRKGIDMALQAFSQLKEHPDVVYVIVGDGPDKKRLQYIAKQYGVTDRVRFVGNVSHSNLACWYTRCDLFIMPTRKLSNSDVEGFGIVFLEANSFGKPVIAGKSGGVTDAVIDGETGFLVDPTDLSMITDALHQLLSDSELARTLGAEGKKRVEEQFQWDQQAERLRLLLE